VKDGVWILYLQNMLYVIQLNWLMNIMSVLFSLVSTLIKIIINKADNTAAGKILQIKHGQMVQN
jgi:hypothetical protein